MASEYQIIRIDNLTVRKMDLKIGENIIGNDIDTEMEDEPIIKQAVKIDVSSDGDMFITPYDKISCYIKMYGALHWKLLTANEKVPLRIRDTCLIFPIKIWFRVIPVKDTEESEIRSLKRKLEEIIEDEPPDKRRCSEVSEEIQVEPSSYVLNSGDASELIKVDCSDNLEGDCLEENELYLFDDLETIDSNSVQCLTFDIYEDLVSPSTTQSNHELHSESNKSFIKNSNVKKLGSDENIDNRIAYKENSNINKTSENYDNISNQMFTTNIQKVSEEKRKYGDKCNSLNTQHKSKFNRRGNSDHDLHNNRFEGLNEIKCNRKKLHHKLDYKHTRNKRKSKPPLRPASPIDLSDLDDSDDESVDESHYNASFLDIENLGKLESYYKSNED